MTLREQLDVAIAEEKRLTEEKRKAWDLDPGNTSIQHNIYGPWGFHEAFKAWVAARDRVRELEKKLAEQEAAA